MSIIPPRRIPKLSKPPRLRSGDTICLVAPASPPYNPSLLDMAKRRLSELGYEVRIGRHAREKNGFLAGSDRHRVLDLNKAFRSKSVRAIFCVRGGYGTGRILSQLDFTALRRSPKILVGCSDLTTLLCGALVRSGIMTFHGPTMQSLMQPDCPTFTWDSFLAQIGGTPECLGPLGTHSPESRSVVDCLYAGKATGRLVGGNLSIINSLIGTPFLPSLAGSILCLEDVGETPFRIDRTLTHLLNVGLFNGVKGFALGTFDKCAYKPQDAESLQSLRDVVIDRLRPLKKPIVLGLPFGHIPHNATLPLGATATLDARRGELIIEEPGVN
jgi:muramoyltetrapeptide carboxypeptidase